MKKEFQVLQENMLIEGQMKNFPIYSMQEFSWIAYREI